MRLRWLHLVEHWGCDRGLDNCERRVERFAGGEDFLAQLGDAVDGYSRRGFWELRQEIGMCLIERKFHGNVDVVGGLGGKRECSRE